MTKEEIIKAIESMTVLELAELVKALEEKFGVSAVAAPIAIAAAAVPGAAAPAAEAKVEEKTEFKVVIKDAGPNKIQVIKVVRQFTDLGLKEAKDLVEKLPAVVKEGISKEEAEEIKKKLEEVGAKVDLE